MTNLREAAQMALDALVEIHPGNMTPMAEESCNKAIEALRAALAQPEKDVPEVSFGNMEPVAWMCPDDPERETAFNWKSGHCVDCGKHRVPVYTTPPQREFIGLTDEEMMVAAFQAGFDVHEDYDNEDDPDALHWWSEDGEQCDDTLHKLRDIIEAKLKEKNK